VALHTVQINSSNSLKIIREKFLTTLRDMVEEKWGKSLDDRVTSRALRILLIAYEGETRFTQLFEIYGTLLERESAMARTALGLIVENDADKVKDLRKLLYERLKKMPKVSASQREMIKDHLTQL